MLFRIRTIFFNFIRAYLFFSIYIGAEPLKFEIKGESAILLNAETGNVLFEHNAYSLLYPASTTKIATALYVLKQEGLDLEMPIVAEQKSLGTVTQKEKIKSKYHPSYVLEPDGTHIGIKTGEVLKLHDLLRGMLICSGNDAANVIAHALGPTIPVFMDLMNAYLKEIGCKQTKFCNPHGLHDPQHQTTAYDLSIMAREALKIPVFCDIVSQQRFIRPKTNKQASTTLLQSNRLVRPGKYYYSKAIGIKTGYHSNAKKNLVSAAKMDGRILIAVLLGYQDRNAVFEDAIKLFEIAFNQPKVQRVFLKEGPQSFKLDLPKANRSLQTYLKESLNLVYYPAEDPQVKCLLYWQNVSLPIQKDQQVAELHLVSKEGGVLKKVPLLAQDTVSLAWPYSWLEVFSPMTWMLLISGGIIGILVFRLIRSNNQ